MGRKKKKRYKPKLKCKYCIYFNTSKDVAINETETKEKYSRYCYIIDNRVVPESKICKEFKMNKYFWCESCGYRLEVEVCVVKKKCHCTLLHVKNCKQRKLLKEYMDEQP